MLVLLFILFPFAGASASTYKFICVKVTFSIENILSVTMMKLLVCAAAAFCVKASDVVTLTIDNFEEQVCCVLCSLL
jgi:hypothetical protein